MRSHRAGVPEDVEAYLKPGKLIDSDHPAVREFARAHAGRSLVSRDAAVSLYYAVRDGFRYDPYRIDATEHGLKASSVLQKGFGFCVTKAALLAAAARASGIPARVGFADVRNHLTSPRLREAMKTNDFVFHGYTELFIDGRWLKATPVFNRSLCDKANVRPLEFDGTANSIFHEFDAHGRRHMEYLRDRGTYFDVPLEELVATFDEVYPDHRSWIRDTVKGEFQDEVDAGQGQSE